MADDQETRVELIIEDAEEEDLVGCEKVEGLDTLLFKDHALCVQSIDGSPALSEAMESVVDQVYRQLINFQWGPWRDLFLLGLTRHPRNKSSIRTLATSPIYDTAVVRHICDFVASRQYLTRFTFAYFLALCNYCEPWKSYLSNCDSAFAQHAEDDTESGGQRMSRADFGEYWLDAVQNDAPSTVNAILALGYNVDLSVDEPRLPVVRAMRREIAQQFWHKVRQERGLRLVMSNPWNDEYSYIADHLRLVADSAHKTVHRLIMGQIVHFALCDASLGRDSTVIEIKDQQALTLSSNSTSPIFSLSAPNGYHVIESGSFVRHLADVSRTEQLFASLQKIGLIPFLAARHATAVALVVKVANTREQRAPDVPHSSSSPRALETDG